MRNLPSYVTELARDQHGVLSRRQLAEYGFTWHQVDRRLRSGHWSVVSANVIAIQPYPVDRLGLLFAASLHFPNHALTGVAALELCGLKAETSGVIDLVGPRGTRVPPFELARLHTSRREVVKVEDEPSRTDHPTTVLNAMAWARTGKQANFYALFAIQRGLVTIDELYATVSLSLRNQNFRASLPHLARIDPGVSTLTEQEFLRLCRRGKLPEPERQSEFRDSKGGRRFADFAFKVSGKMLVVEIDGAGHLATDVRLDDVQRANDLARLYARVIRIPAPEIYLNPEFYLDQIRRTLHAMAA